MQKELLDKFIEELEKVDDEINYGTKWSQSVKLNRVLANLKEYRKECFEDESKNPL